MENTGHSNVKYGKQQKNNRSSTRYKNFTTTNFNDDEYSHEKKYKTKLQNYSNEFNSNSYRNQRRFYNYKTRYPHYQHNNVNSNYQNNTYRGEYKSAKFQKFPSHKIQTSQQIDFSKLPSLALTKIFSYMNLTECLNASSTCKIWRANLMLNSPSLWHKFPLTIYLCNKHDDLESHKFKLNNFSNLCSSLNFKFDANDFYLIKKLNDSLMTSQFLNLKQLRLDPVFNLYIDDDIDSMNADYYDDCNSTDNITYLGKLILNSLIKIITYSKFIEHLSIGFFNYKNASDSGTMKELLISLSKLHTNSLKSLHISTCAKSASVYLNHKQYNSKVNFKSMMFDNYIPQFIHLESLSLDYKDLSNSMIQSNLFRTSLKRLNLNVDSIETLNESQKLERNNAWLSTSVKNPNLRVSINCICTEEANRKYANILNIHMPLKTFRMYFCKSFNPDIIQHLNDNYNETLESLTIIDGIIEPTLRYHNPLRLDADPDPLVLLCWKCKNLNKLIVIGYEVLEINLIAIAKLRSNLTVFNVAMDCVIDLKYGKFRSDDDFIEDEDGDDTIVDYGSCSDHVIDKVSSILKNPNWQPLEKEELPLCIYDCDVPYEEAYLHTLLADQQI